MKVLILVLMEDSLGDLKKKYDIAVKCLNPCFNGRFSRRLLKNGAKLVKGLNPCFNGRFSRRPISFSAINM